MAARTLVYLVRHGEQSSDETGPDPGLSELGRRQAHRLGQRLRAVPFDAVHHGPAARAAQTAQEIAAHLPGVAVHECRLAADVTPVPAAGRADQAVPQRYADFLDAVPAPERDPGAVRLRAAVDHWGQVGDADRYELVVTHNFVIGWFVRHALDAPFWRWLGLNQFNCGLTILQWRADAPPNLVSFNDIGHLPPGERGRTPTELLS
ncbi:histidine phosphatase family protein [Micromonospora sp. NBC_01813]|uniref:histidine phosphatase family protein n=1 Tax=Micromonospora sp. NBC_01813 TaxID=2975988 RepID=UPI002DD7FEF9|nr:histidine phosphatase family protein [Micromonospora sp. NBC_01813]WSA09477.1 histidine phosphatase family protein [Micromonospora sp. NBC_01813]